MEPKDKKGSSVPLRLSQSFNNTNEKPAQEFERRANVTGVAGEYIFPEGKVADDVFLELQKLINETNHNLSLKELQDHIDNTWDELVTLNPELSVIEHIDDYRLKADAISGVASLFNIDDICFFIDFRRTVASFVAIGARQYGPYRELWNTVEKLCEDQTAWVPAPKTLSAIFEQVKDRKVAYFMNERRYIAHPHIDDELKEAIDQFVAKRMP